MNLYLLRHTFTPTATFGTLYVDDVFSCYILEDASRLSGGFPKIPGSTAIPEGIFEVRLTMSQRFRYITPEILGVPGYSGVRIHPGNRVADTEGCLLPGMKISGAEAVLDSRIAFAALLAKFSGISSSTIEIVNALGRPPSPCLAIWEEERKST